MAASQAELQRQLNTINARLAEIQAILNRSTRGTPRSRELTAEKKKLEEEKRNLERQLRNITTIPSSQDPSARGLNRAEVPAPPPPVTPNPTNTGLQGSTVNTRKQESVQQNFNVEINNDWRVRLYLAPNSSYLYNDPNNLILSPLRNSNGVIFPYTPTINVTYSANYDPQDVMHSNYKLYFYKNSSVDNISIVCDFTAQDTIEANYLLAVIHFFKSVTKMFYGKDQNPTNGTPPPLVYIDGFGTYQFNKHPLLITNFTYALPNDVDYIRAAPNPTVPAGISTESQNKDTDGATTATARLGDGASAGGNPLPPRWTRRESGVPTYVPTKMSITLNAIPVISRKDISDNFSLQGYANGSLLLGRSNSKIGAGIW